MTWLVLHLCRRAPGEVDRLRDLVRRIFVASRPPPSCPTKFEDAESNEATSYLPGSAESTHALNATESLQKGEIAPAVIIYRRESGLTAADQQDDRSRRRADDREALPRRHRRRRDRRRPAARSRPREALDELAPKGLPSGCGTPTTTVPGQPAGYAPFVGPICSTDGKAAIVTAYIKGNGEGERIVDPVKDWRDKISDDERRPGGEDHRRRRLLRRRDRSLRRDQRDPAAGRGQPRDLPPDRDLPLADVLPDPAGRGAVRRDPLALARLRADRARRHRQRPVELDHVGARARGGDRLRPLARLPLPRGAAPHRSTSTRR